MSEKQSLLKSSVDVEKDASKCFWQWDLAPCIPARYVLVVISCLGFINVYALRGNLSMAIVAMVNNSANASSHLQYNWTSEEQGWILSSFFYGYIITQIPGGYLADLFGARYVFGLGILMTSVLTLLTPLAAEIHIGALLVLRALEGFFEGVTYPAMHSLLGNWSPTKERSIMTTIAYAGSMFGNIISFPLSAVLCEYGFAGGWPSVFYFFGCLGVIWFVFWMYLGFSSPATHPRISDAEREYIESSIAKDKVNQANGKTPWLHIITSPAVWAISIGYFCYTWGFYILLACIPSYFNDVLGLSLGKNLIQNGLFSAIPYVGFVIVSLTSGQIGDFLRRRGYVSTVVVRKFCTTGGLVLPAAGLLITGYFGSTKVDCVLFLTIAVSFSGLGIPGLSANHIDIAPQYAGILMGITNGIATIPGIIGPLVAKTIAHKPLPGQDKVSVYREEWREVFIIAAEIYIFGALVYLILGKGERQWWAGGVSGDGTTVRKGEKKDDLHTRVFPPNSLTVTIEQSESSRNIQYS